MLIAVLLRLAQSYPINDTSMIQFVAKHSILVAKQHFKLTGVGSVTTRIQNAVFTTVKLS